MTKAEETAREELRQAVADMDDAMTRRDKAIVKLSKMGASTRSIAPDADMVHGGVAKVLTRMGA